MIDVFCRWCKTLDTITDYDYKKGRNMHCRDCGVTREVVAIVNGVKI